jgi:Flp pilus assembly protein TadG
VRCRRKSSCREQRNDRGAVAVEFALILVPFLMILVGVLEFSLAFNHQQSLHAAAREGARAGALVPGSECAAANSAMSASVGGGTCAVVTNCPGDSVLVTMTASRDISIVFLPVWTVNLTGKGEFRCE